MIFLLATAAVLNAAFGSAPIPRPLRNAAVLAHLATVMAALPLGVSQLVLPKGTLRHRSLGYIWCGLMTFTALISFAIHQINARGLSPIHLFSVLTLVCVPVIIVQARRHDVEGHRRTVLGLMIGALVIAGFFTFLPSRALGGLLFRLVWPR